MVFLKYVTRKNKNACIQTDSKIDIQARTEEASNDKQNEDASPCLTHHYHIMKNR